MTFPSYPYRHCRLSSQTSCWLYHPTSSAVYSHFSYNCRLQFLEQLTKHITYTLSSFTQKCDMSLQSMSYYAPSMSMDFSTATTAPTVMLWCAAASRCLSVELLIEAPPVLPLDWLLLPKSLAENSLSNKWHVRRAPGSASWSPPDPAEWKVLLISIERVTGLLVCSHWTTPVTIPVTIIVGSTVICRALHTAPRSCTDPTGYFWPFHRSCYTYRSQYRSVWTYCRGAMNNNDVFGLCCRRGLLAYVYTGVSVLMNALVSGKWLLYTTAQWPWPSRSDTYHFRDTHFRRWLYQYIPDVSYIPDGHAASNECKATWRTKSSNVTHCLAIRIAVNTAMESWIDRSLTCIKDSTKEAF